MLRFVFSSGNPRSKGPAIFIDRDGVINCRRPDDYVLNWEQFVFVPGIRKALKQLSSLHLPIIVISNQAAVGKGLLSIEGLEDITKRMQQTLTQDATALTAAYYCTHRTDEACICRKPKPELLIRAATDFNIELAPSIFIGDSKTDVEAARAAGCGPILLGAGIHGEGESAAWMIDLPAARQPEELFDVVVSSLRERRLLQSEKSVARLP